MRQVRARLLKLAGNLGLDSDSDEDQPQAKIEEPIKAVPAPPPQAPQVPKAAAPVIPRKSGKRESKWGKTASNESSFLPISQATESIP